MPDKPAFTELPVSSRYRPATRGEKITLWLLGVGFCGTIAAGLLKQFVPQKLSIVFFVVLWGVMLVVHELGHAVAARALGWRVGEMSIGFGPVLWRGHVGGTRVVLRLIPVEGYVMPAPASAQAARIKSALIYAAGPGIELVVLAALVAWLGVDTVFNDSDDPALIALKTLAIVIVWGAGFNLLPFASGGAASDGLGILLSPFMTHETIEQRMLALDEKEVRRLAFGGETDAALARLDALIARGVQTEQLERLRITVLTDAGRYLQARQRFDALVGDLDATRSNDPFTLHLRALIALETPDENSILAERLLNQALRLAPGDVSISLTRGIAHIQAGRNEIGGNLIADVFRRIDARHDQARALGYLAVAAARSRDTQAAKRFWQAFEHVNASVDLQRQVRALLPAAMAATSDPSQDRP